MNSTKKIFGIGSPKTGTSSLRLALKELGFNHKPYDFLLSNRVYKAGDYEAVFRAAEKYDSFEDGPWNRDNFYQKLDQRFPNSKFILTIRDMQSWIKSHEKHFSVNGLRQIPKELWRPPYTDEIKAELIESHSKRIESIQKYFQSRPQDLLVLNVCEGEGWEKLCPFLGLPIRNEPFPHTNITKSLSYKGWHKWRRATKQALRNLVK